MAESFNNLIRSDLFTFHVGTGKKKDAIQVHSRAIAATCDYMRNLIEGDMKEAQDRSAEQDMETVDFVRFVEYAYRGDYTAPSCVLETSTVRDEVNMEVADPPTYEEEAPPPPPPEDPIEEAADPGSTPFGVPVEEDSSWGFGSKKSKKKIKVKEKTSSFRTDVFNKRDYLRDGDPKEAILQGFVTEYNTAPEQDFTPVFLAYARLYSFAEMRLIHQLKALTLHKLHRTLQSFTLFPARVGDVIELARHTYENTPNRTADGTVDELRKLVVDYIACEHLAIGESKEFREWMEEGGEFVSDFWDVVSNHLIRATT